MYATVVIENAPDAHDARVGRIPSASVRRVVIEQMMADTGASHPFLPRDLIDRLGLEPVKSVQVQTAAGISEVSVFEAARFVIPGSDNTERIGTFEVLELPGGSEPLLGLTVMEGLGITPDVVNHRFVFLPETAESSHYTAYRA